MKKPLIILAMALLPISGIHAQKFGFVDTDNILKQIPEYQAAQTKIDQISADWQSEIEKMYQEIDKMYRSYQAEEILLTEEMKKERQNTIIAKEKGAKDYQKKKFWFEGELFQKRQELVKPVQDKVYEAIKKIAKDKQLQFMFDRSAELVMLYADEKFNFTRDVLQELGINENQEKSTEKQEGKEQKPKGK